MGRLITFIILTVVVWIFYSLFSISDVVRRREPMTLSPAVLVSEPRRFLDKPVLLEGVCTGSFYASLFGAYLVTDADSEESLWVLTTKFPPMEGSRIRVVGQLKPVLKMFNEKGLLLREIEVELLPVEDATPRHLRGNTEELRLN